MPKDYAVIVEELHKTKKKIDNLTEQLEKEKEHQKALYAELVQIQEKLKAELGIQDPNETAGQVAGKRKARTPESNLMISTGKVISRCHVAGKTPEEAKEVAKKEAFTLAKKKYGMTALPKSVLERVEDQVATIYGKK